MIVARVFLAAVVVGLSVELAGAALPGDKGRLVFASDREGQEHRLYVLSQKGDDANPLAGTGPAINPKWSRRGTRIAFVRLGNAAPEIYVIGTDGSGLRNVSKSSASDVNPSWSPDEHWVAFASNRDGNYEIYAAPVDGSAKPLRLTRSPTRDVGPAWSPDGQLIAFESAGDIRVMSSQGTAARWLSRDGVNASPAWSPDGRRIAFSSNRDGNYEIYVMNADGSNSQRLTRDDRSQPFSDTDPAWSPDGGAIAFTTSRAGKSDIYVMSATGSDMTQLTTHSGEDTTPSWWPQLAPFAEVRRRVASGVLKIAAETCDGGVVGTGFLVGGQFIVTADHVVSGAREIVLVRGTKKLASATVVGRDRRTDVALLRSAKPIAGYRFSFAGRARDREEVVALGYRLYGGGVKMTEGIVENRGQTVKDENGTTRHNLLQVSDGVPEGNSGGPLFRKAGENGDAGDILGLVIRSGTDTDEAYAVPAPVVAPKVSAWRKAPKTVRATC